MANAWNVHIIFRNESSLSDLGLIQLARVLVRGFFRALERASFEVVMVSDGMSGGIVGYCILYGSMCVRIGTRVTFPTGERCCFFQCSW